MSSAPAVALASWYLLDRDNRVIDVSPDWDAAAQAGQGGGNAFRDGVIGRPLGRFLAGDTTRMFIESALQAVRLTQQPRLLNYRCDAPALSRQMQMRLQPLPDGWVRVEHMLVQARPRATALRFETCSAVLLPSPGTPPWLRCSICLWVCTPQGYWEPPEHVHAARPLQVDYVVCPRCQAEMTPPG
ncbi:hypothetical protein X805_28140 [Sphaerotilus natans subsp. natans DSM 6575]|uniref:Uncharacterized protein n=1 Tax=Sphaerotilus natans subsp. natans DSM 6575 TaxID=1286631 RepID=A0A059KK86_9BURK|nr:hypothetical protein [Sphaerotilus natans]KDB51614.1 hypothetical protein X805_28140 [Sphaerotilus natans subsp. natans DSM 6575]